MKYVTLLVALAVGACGSTGPDLAQSADQCHYGSRPFIEAWPCVRDTFATRRDGNPGIQMVFLERGDAVWQRAKAGQITEQEARSAIRLAAAEARAAEDQANAVAGVRDALVISQMRTYAPPPTTMTNCTTVGSITNCYSR